MVFRIKRLGIKKKLVLLLVTPLVVIYALKQALANISIDLKWKTGNNDDCGVYGCIDEYIDFEGFDNEIHGAGKPIVPNIIHLIYLNKAHLKFHEAICIFSIYLNHKPSLIYIHCNNCSFWGENWDWLKEDKGLWSIIKLNQISSNLTIFGVEPKWIHHKSDVLRLLALMNYGGFYFDNDMFIIKPLHKYRKYEMTVSMSGPNGTTTGCQIMIAHRNARLLKAHYDVYR
jgi:hypothetical protein